MHGNFTPESLSCHVVGDHKLTIRPAPVERDWMDRTPQRFAYRCLPMNIANAHGWEILCNDDFTAAWDGTQDKSGITLTPPGIAVSHFGSGILTFHIPCIFRTEPGVDLYVTGPVNRPKDGIAPLSGVIETDWAPYTFTMNWMFTRENVWISFKKDEPICHLFPVDRGRLERVEPQLARLSDAPELEKEYNMWSQSRDVFNKGLQVDGSEARQQRWQKSYFRGQRPDGEAGGAESHRSKLCLQPFPALNI